MRLATKSFLLPFLLIAVGHCSDPSIADLQKSYVGHRAYLNLSTISCWHKTVDVVSIIPSSGGVQGPTTINALGERVPIYASDPVMEVTVRCPDGKIEKSNILQSTVPSAFEKVPDPLSDAEQSILQVKLQSLVGKTLYSSKGTDFYPATSSLADLESQDAGKANIHISQATPLKVVTFKIWNADKGTLALLKLSSTVQGDIFVVLSGRESNGSIVDPPIRGKLVSLPPTCWVPGTEKGWVSVGASEKGVVCQLGEPTKINDYGRGEEQWIYDSPGEGTQLIYLKDGIVVNIQKMDR